MGDRYFPAVALGGRLYVDSLAEHEPWDSNRLNRVNKDVMEVFVDRMTHKKADTVDELKEILRTSESGLPAIRVWVYEGLASVARTSGITLT